MGDNSESGRDAIERYLVLVDISGYTAFLAGVEETHGQDFSAGLPAGYQALGELIQGVIDDLSPDFELVKVEGDAVFGSAPAAALDGRGNSVSGVFGKLYRAFVARRDVLAVTARDDKCTACFAVASLDLKAVVHRGLAVRQLMGGSADLVGPAVNVAHRLLKNTVRERIGAGPYLLLTEEAAEKLGQADAGLGHREAYPGLGEIGVRIMDLAEVAGIAPTTWASPPAGTTAWPQVKPIAP